MKKISLLFFICVCFICSSGQGQSSSKENAATDNYVKQLGALQNFNLATIADTITRNFTTKKEKVRAIFYWIANNISLDPKAIKQNITKTSLPETVVQLRKATPLGFSLLVQEMCSLANIRCLSVDGYVKNFPEEINNKADEVNHSWNVVQLGQSPEEWYYVDAAKASGYLDKKMTLFTRQFTSEYFFADRALFNLDHYPDNGAWQLGAGPKNIKEFYALPVISNAAYEYGLRKPLPLAGYIKTHPGDKVDFSFTRNDKTITAIELIIGDRRNQQKPLPMNFDAGTGIVRFSYQFKKEDSYPVKLVVDGKELLSYYVEVSE